MGTVSVPLSKQHQDRLDTLVKQGAGSSRADVMRKALDKFAEEEAIAAVLQAQRELGKGKVFKGDLRQIAKRFAR
jgi:Arc/MetJ-type ribon-helix-helix transcriptional regulator